MALKGDLKDFSTTQLLNLINLAKKSGTLFIERSDDSKANVAFKNGKLIHATLGEQDGNLTLVLAKTGKLTKEQAKQVAERAKNATDKQLGLMLINAGYVTQADIVQSIKSHLQGIILKLFGWDEGAFHFDADKAPPADRITVSIELENLIMEGSRRLKELDRLEEELPNLDMALKFPGQPSAKLGKVNLSVEEWKVISFVKAENTIRMIAKTHNLSDQEIRKIVYSLLQAGLVELTRPAGAEAARAAVGAARRARQTRSPLDAPEAKARVVNKLIDRIRAL
jgi:hypothetical protein